MNMLGRAEPGGSLRTHLNRMLCGVERAVLGYERRYFGGLEQRLPCILVLHAVEPLERLVFGRVELPNIISLSLTRKDPVDEHDLDHVDKLDFLAYHIFDAGLKSGQLHR